MRQPNTYPLPLTTLPADLVALLTEADHAIRRLEPENPYRLYEFLHTTVRRFAPVDAFYVCLYSEADQALFFAYNAEGDVYDAPLTLPLGDGPTSRAIKQRRPIVWNNEAKSSMVNRIRFGQVDRITRSAMHVPIHAHSGNPGTDGTILGVISAQAYPADAYPPQSVHALQWLADRAGMALTRERDEAAWRYRLKAADVQASDRQRPMLAMADEFVTMLQDLARQAEDARRLLPPDADAVLSHTLTQLCRECCAAQTKANQLPLRHGLSPNPTQPSAINQLTPSERIVLQHIAAGKPNKIIAHELHCGEDTVKFHCKNIFQKLEVSSRTAAARLWLKSNPDSHL
ncbi:MAG: LuxR C-terminal-related transcriptional regulator [Janthinobacterium lividum]